MGTLRGGLWHTTSECRYKGIQICRAILANPPIPERERWGTQAGPLGWPFVRKLGGVSLFDFDGFDAQAYQHRWPSSSWRQFVPIRPSWGASVWIEIDRSGVANKLLSGCALLEKWHDEGAHRHQLMPLIEACHMGDIPQDLFVRVLAIGKGDAAFRSLTG